jgi:hypothetical protein
LTTAEVAACGRLGWRTLEFPLCGGAEAGALFGRGTGIDDPNVDRLAWVAGIAHGALVWVPTPRFATYARAGLGVPLSTYRFHVNGDQRVHEAAVAAFRATFGVQMRLW